MLAHWVVVRDIPTTLNLPTLLDIDPSAASERTDRPVGQSSAVAPETGRGRRMKPEPPVSLWPDPEALGPVTDLYELTMMAGYYASGMAGRQRDVRAVRAEDAREPGVPGLRRARAGDRRPAPAGLRPGADRGDPPLAGISSASIRRSWKRWPSLRFEGDVWSVPEGTVVFPGRDAGPGHGPSAAGSVGRDAACWRRSRIRPWWRRRRPGWSRRPAAGRSSSSARGAGTARTPGMLAARAAYIAGFAGTSHVEAARRLGIPAVGTMAHSWVQSFATETEAFAAFARVFPANTTPAGRHLRHARGRAAAPPRSSRRSRPSGSTAATSETLARQARAILDQHGRPMVKIIASGDLDEYRIAQLVASGAPIDGFGVGTELITSRDAPALAMVYKLVELDGEGKFKLSPGKRTYPMAKQVFRRRDRTGRFCGDHVTRADETAEGEPLLVPILRSGRLVTALPSLESIRGRCREQLAALPERLLRAGCSA